MKELEHSRSFDAICGPRWRGWTYRGIGRTADPCNGCPLNKPCVKDSPNIISNETLRHWNDARNKAAEAYARVHPLTATDMEQAVLL